MSETRKLAYALLTLSFVMIMSGSVSTFVLGLKADRVETLQRMTEVNSNFEGFNNNVNAFEELRDNLYSSTLSEMYYTTIFKNDKEIKNKLSNYENYVDELKKNTDQLKQLCENVYYPDSKVNNKCANYKTIYEQVVNYFVSDIKKYNTNVDKYNKYQLSKSSMFLVDKYNTDKKYVDYNGDGKFDGKE